MELVYVPTHPSGHADLKAMAKAVGSKTALMVGIAGTTELGLVDPIEEMALWCSRNDTLLHVDAAFGGYVLPFLEDAGRKPLPFDFKLPGVWSLAIDPHKMGLATIPGGALLLRDGADWERIAVKSPYVSTESQSTLMGTRPGAAVAAAWAVHRHLGRDGFASLVETCLDNTTYLAAQLQRLGIEPVAPPETNVLAFRSGNAKALQVALQQRGFRLNLLPRLGALRVVVGPHVTRKTLDRLLAALHEVA
jgi:tyrosine decarboxylase / aspartate 1-decarboxylase